MLPPIVIVVANELSGSADCVMVGVGEVLKDKKIDLVVSGVNAGVNIGGDVGFSGTVGAAMTANVLGLPGVALSQAWKERDNILKINNNKK